MIVWDLVYGLSEPNFRIPFLESYHVSSNFTKCQYYTNFKWPYFRTAAVTWSGMLVVLCVLHILMWPWPDPRSRSLNFWKLHFSTSTSATILALHSQLIGDYRSMGPSLQIFGASFLNFSPSWRSRDFEVREMLMSPESTVFYLSVRRR